jgi:hypothetical protein
MTEDLRIHTRFQQSVLKEIEATRARRATRLSTVDSIHSQFPPQGFEKLVGKYFLWVAQCAVLTEVSNENDSKIAEENLQNN